MKRILRMAFILFLLPSLVYALNNPKEKWYVYSSYPYRIIYQKELEEVVIRISERLKKMFSDLTDSLDFEFRTPLTIIIADDSDIPNGFAVEELDLVFVYSTSLYFPIRERSPWFYNVLTHEVTHIIARRKRSLFPKIFPFLSAGGVFVLPEKGVEGVIAVYIPSKIEPTWFTEGLAQLMSEKMGFDRWDSYRDMLLRIAYLNDELLTYDEMVSFKDKKGLLPEMVYNQGYSFLRFVVKEFGDGILLRFLKEKSSLLRSFESIFRQVSGEEVKRVYKKWRKYLEEKYSPFKEMKEKAGEKGKMKGNFVLFSGKRKGVKFYVKGDNSFFKNKLVLKKGEKEKTVDRFISSPPYFSSDGKKIVYTRFRVTYLDSIISEMRIYDIEKDRKVKTGIKRAFYPVFSPDDEKVYYVKNQSGNQNIYVYDLKSKEERAITEFKDEEQITGLDVDGEGNLIFTLYKRGESDIWKFILKSGKMKRLTETSAEERDVKICAKGIVFSADYSGVFNIYFMEPQTGKRVQLTNLKGGGFYPYPSTDCSEVFYTYYGKDGFLPYVVKLDKGQEVQSDSALNEIKVKYKNIKELNYLSKEFKNNFLNKRKKYRFVSNPVHFYPSFLFYFENAGLGLGIDFSDKLMRHMLGGAGIFSLDGDQYYSLAYINRSWYPTFILRGTSKVASSLLPTIKFRGKHRYTTGEFYALFPVIPVIPYLKFEYRNYRKEYMEYEKKSQNSERYKENVEVYVSDFEVKEKTTFESYGVGAGIFIAPDETFGIKFEYTRWFTNGVDDWLFNLFTPLYLHFNNYWFDRIYLSVSKKWNIKDIVGVDVSAEGGYISRNVHYYDEFSLGGLLVFPLIYEVVENFHLPGYRPFVMTGEAAARTTVGLSLPSIRVKKLLFPFYFSQVSFRVFTDLGWFMKMGKEDTWKNVYPDIGLETHLSSNIFYNYPFDINFQIAWGLKEYKLEEDLYGGHIKESARWLGVYITAGVEF